MRKCHHHGFSLIELAIGIAVSGFGILAASALYLNGYQSQSDLSSRKDAQDIRSELRARLKKEAVCTPNFQNKILPTAKSPTTQAYLPLNMTDDIIDYNTETGAPDPGPPLLRVVDPEADTRFKVYSSQSPKLRILHPMDRDSVVAQLEIFFSTMNSSGNRTLSPITIPIIFEVDDAYAAGGAKIIRCKQNLLDSNSTRKSICETMFGGTYKWDAATQKCVNAVDCFEGDAYEATCPAGHRLAPWFPSQPHCTITNQDSIHVPDEFYKTYVVEGVTYYGYGDVIWAESPDDNKCVCSYAEGLAPTAISKCKICCMKDE